SCTSKEISRTASVPSRNVLRRLSSCRCANGPPEPFFLTGFSRRPRRLPKPIAILSIQDRMKFLAEQQTTKSFLSNPREGSSATPVLVAAAASERGLFHQERLALTRSRGSYRLRPAWPFR